VIRWLAGALVVVALTGACGGSDDKTADQKSTTTTAPAPPVTMKVAGVTAVVRGSSIAADGLEVELDDNYFRPNVILGTASQQVSLELINEGKSVHNFTFGDTVSTDIQPGAHATVRVTMPASGDAAFFCKFHKDEAGMAGALVASL
jgi:plastocyanin